MKNAGLFAALLLLGACAATARTAAPSVEPPELTPSIAPPTATAVPPTPTAVPPTPSTQPDSTPATSAQLIVYQDAKSAGSEQDTIWVATADGLDQHAIVHLPGLNDQHPDWSPDGTQITFSHEVSGSKDIWVSSADGSNPEQLYDSPADMPWAEFPAWSHDGRAILAVTYDREPNVHVAGRSSLVLIDVATGEADEIAVLEGEHEVFAYPRWSPDGESIVASLGVFSDDGSAWAGEEIVVLRHSADGWSDPAPITDPGLFGSYPDWHPTEDLIVFVSPDRGWFWYLTEHGISPQDFPTALNLYTVRSDGSDLTAVTSYPASGVVGVLASEAAGQPTWTSDGRIICINRHADVVKTSYMERDGTGLVTLPFLGVHPRLQPTP